MSELLRLTAEQGEQLLLAAGIFVAGAVLARLLVFVLNRHVRDLTERTETTVDDVVLDAINGPLFWMLTVSAAWLGVTRLTFLSADTFAVLSNVVFILYVIVGYVLLYRLIGNVLEWYTQDVADTTETSLDDQLVPFLRRVTLIALTLIAGIILLDRFGVPVGSLIATLGVGSLAIALAAQESLRDVISGILIIFDRPYRIGDRIFMPQAEILGQDVLGDVIDVGLRSTRIITRDNRMVIVPNSVMAQSMIVNLAYPDRRLRLDVPVGVAYGTDIDEARDVLVEGVRGLEGLLPEPAPRVLVTELANSAVAMKVRCWIDSFTDMRQMTDNVATAAYNALNEAGIEIPYPQQTVWHRVERAQIENLHRAGRAINGGETPGDGQP